MKRGFVFAGRNMKELLRDPLSYIFCLGFPLIMFAVMSAINSLIPPESGMDIFTPAKLTPGIAVFGLSFVMLFSTLLLSKDRSSAFLIRLYSSPMTAFDFIFGYTLPLLVMAIAQIVITYVTGAVVAAVSGNPLGIAASLLSSLSMIITAIIFIGLGMIFGTLFNENAAPPCSSIVISSCGIVGGIWFDISIIPDGNFFKYICLALPFSHSVDLGRGIIAGNYNDAAINIAVLSIWTVCIAVIAILLFSVKMKSEKK